MTSQLTSSVFLIMINVFTHTDILFWNTNGMKSKKKKKKKKKQVSKLPESEQHANNTDWRYTLTTCHCI
jgi:hypothetical protein